MRPLGTLNATIVSDAVRIPAGTTIEILCRYSGRLAVKCDDHDLARILVPDSVVDERKPTLRSSIASRGEYDALW